VPLACMAAALAFRNLGGNGEKPADTPETPPPAAETEPA
jgi:hypothetical protein